MEYFISVICTKYMYQMTEWLKMSTNISLEPKPKCLSHEDILWKSTFSQKGRQLSLFLHSFIVLSCFLRPVRWSSASVCRIYEWTGWFPYLIYFPSWLLSFTPIWLLWETPSYAVATTGTTFCSCISASKPWNLKQMSQHDLASFPTALLDLRASHLSQWKPMKKIINSN